MTPTPESPRQDIYPVYCHILSPTIGRWCPLWATDINALKDVGIFCDGRKLLHYGNHPIKWVRVTGVIVAIDCGGNGSNFKRIYTLDDSSGSCIECSAPAPNAALPASKNTPLIQNQSEELKKKNLGDKVINPTRSSGQGQRGKQNKATSQSELKSEGPSILNPIVPWDKVHVGSVVKIKGKVDVWWDHKRIEIVKLEILRCTDIEVRCWNEVIRFREDILNKSWVLTAKQERRCKKRVNRQTKNSYKESR